MERYYVTRTTNWDDEKPCEEAFKTQKKHPNDEDWSVDIESIRAFVDKYGDCVISKIGPDEYTIEIYDGWRE